MHFPIRFLRSNSVRVCLTLTLLLLLAAADLAIGKVKAFPATGKNIWDYKTYQWLPPRVVIDNEVYEDDPTISPLIRQAMNRELSALGFREVAEGGDLTLVTAAMRVQGAQLEGYLMMWGFDWWYGYHPTAVQTLQRTNERGMLFVNIVETDTEAAVWSGFATDALAREGRADKTVDKATRKLFKKFPKKK